MDKQLKWIAMSIIMAVILVFGSLGCSESTSTSTPTTSPTPTVVQPIELSFATVNPETSSFSISAKEWGEELARRTNGQVVISRFHYSGSLLPGTALLEAVGKGVVDLAYLPAGYNPAQLPLTGITEFPFLTNMPDAASLAQAELYDTYAPFKQEWHDSNVEVMFFHVMAPAIAVADKDISTISGLKNLKLRSYGLLNDVVSRLDAIPEAIPAPDIYTSISSGVLDGAVGLPLWYCGATKMYEVAKWWVDPGIGHYATGVVIMTKAKYDSLPDSAKQAIIDLREEWPGKDGEILSGGEAAGYQAAQDAGAVLVRYSEEQMTSLKQMVNIDDLWQKWLQERQSPGVPIEEMFDLYQAAVRKYESQSTYSSPWD